MKKNVRSRVRFTAPGAVPLAVSAAGKGITDGQIALRDRIHVEMPLQDILTVLSEHAIKVWHMEIPGHGEMILFAGAEAKALRQKALAACYGDKT